MVFFNRTNSAPCSANRRWSGTGPEPERDHLEINLATKNLAYTLENGVPLVAKEHTLRVLRQQKVTGKHLENALKRAISPSNSSSKSKQSVKDANILPNPGKNKRSTPKSNSRLQPNSTVSSVVTRTVSRMLELAGANDEHSSSGESEL